MSNNQENSRLVHPTSEGENFEPKTRENYYTPAELEKLKLFYETAKEFIRIIKEFMIELAIILLKMGGPISEIVKIMEGQQRGLSGAIKDDTP